MAQKALSSAAPEDLLSVLERLYPDLRRNTASTGSDVLEEGSSLHAALNSILDIDQAKYTQYIAASTLLRKAIGFEPGEMGIIVNGRVRLILHDFLSLC